MDNRNIYEIMEASKPRPSIIDSIMRAVEEVISSPVCDCVGECKFDTEKSFFEEGDLVTYVGEDKDDLERGCEYEIAEVDEDDPELPYALYDSDGYYVWVSAKDVD